MSEQHENHLHFLVCIDRLQNAWATLNAVRAAKANPLAGPAFRYALVEYATPRSGDDPIEVPRIQVVEGTRQSRNNLQSVLADYAGRHIHSWAAAS